MPLGYSYNTLPGEMWTNVFSPQIGNQAQNKIMIPKFTLVNQRVHWNTFRSMENPKAGVPPKAHPGMGENSQKLRP